MPRHAGNPMITTSVRVSPEFHKLCIEKNISFSEALKIGISIILAERGEIEYDNNLNICRRTEKIRIKLEETINELNELKQNQNA